MMQTETTDPSKLSRLRELLPEINDIADEHTRDAVETIWLHVWQESEWEDLSEIPKNPCAPTAPERVKDAWTLVTHTRAVAQLSITSAETIERLHGIQFQRDQLIALALLHDVSKVVEYVGTKESPEKGKFGELVQHGVYGAFLMWQNSLPVEMVHGVIAHTPQSHTVPRTHEALIIRYCDFLDTDSMLLDAGEELYLK